MLQRLHPQHLVRKAAHFSKIGRLRLRRRIKVWSGGWRSDPVSTGKAGQYGVVSLDPPVIRAMYWFGPWAMMRSLGPLLDVLAHDRLLLLVHTTWWMASRFSVDELAAYHRTHLRRYPKHEVVFMANTEEEHHAFAARGLPSHFVSPYALMDERIFRPLSPPTEERTIDAVYDARFDPFKRHELATGIRSLGLIYGYSDLSSDRRYGKMLRRQFADRCLFNEENGLPYRVLNSEQVNMAMNRCRVGLALSAEEGALWACGQYLLAGLPIVSTPSRGGRDVLFDDDVALIVEPNAEAVARGVEQMVERTIDPEMVRQRTLERIHFHRDRFLTLVQQAYDRAGTKRRARDDWPAFFFHRMFHTCMLHQPVIEGLARVRAGEADPVEEVARLRPGV